MKKTAFTLSEILIALTIIGVVLSIIIPVVRNTVADTGGLLYKKAIADFQNAIDMAKEDRESYAPPYNYSTTFHFLNVTPENFCKVIVNQMSTTGLINCSSDSSDTSEDPSFHQNNGFAYWNVGGLPTETTAFKDKYMGTACNYYTPMNTWSNCIRTIWVDVNGEKKGKNAHGKDIFRFQVRFDGKVMIGTGGDWDTIEQKVLEESEY